MTDLLKRRYVRESEIELQNALVEAHAEIERLRAAFTVRSDTANKLALENERLRAALRRITTDHLESDCHECIRKINIAKEALGGDLENK